MPNPFRIESITGEPQDEFKVLIALSNLKVRALYLQLGGSHIDRLLDRLTQCLEEGADSYIRRLSQDAADYAAYCEDPNFQTPKREKPLMNVREELMLSREITSLMESQRKLALQAVRALNAGIEPMPEYLEAAKIALGRDGEKAARAVAKRDPVLAAPKPVKPPVKTETSAAVAPTKAAA